MLYRLTRPLSPGQAAEHLDSVDEGANGGKRSKKDMPTTKGAVNETLRCAVDTLTVELALPLGWARSHLEVYRFAE
jgi:hypothetical protein